jgi:succinate dehydrogenase flavin-adding protein (antitoxin of CptAB toxin-antitoxin module)
MYRKLVADEKQSEINSADACKLIEVVLQCCRGSAAVDQLLPKILEIAIRRYPSAEYNSFKVLLLEVVGNALYYNVAATLNALEALNATSQVFSNWFQLVFTEFKRTHDKKVTILALSSLYLLPFDSFPPSIKAGFSMIFTTLLKLLCAIKTQKEEIEAKEKDEENEDFVDEDEDYPDIDEEEKGELPTMGVAGGACDTLSMLEKIRKSALFDEDDFLDTDDDIYQPAIDVIDETVFFATCFRGALDRQPDVYQHLLSCLTREDLQTYESLLQHAHNQLTKLSANQSTNNI